MRLYNSKNNNDSKSDRIKKISAFQNIKKFVHTRMGLSFSNNSQQSPYLCLKDQKILFVDNANAFLHLQEALSESGEDEINKQTGVHFDFLNDPVGRTGRQSIPNQILFFGSLLLVKIRIEYHSLWLAYCEKDWASLYMQQIIQAFGAHSCFKLTEPVHFDFDVHSRMRRRNPGEFRSGHMQFSDSIYDLTRYLDHQRGPFVEETIDLLTFAFCDNPSHRYGAAPVRVQHEFPDWFDDFEKQKKRDTETETGEESCCICRLRKPRVKLLPCEHHVYCFECTAKCIRLFVTGENEKFACAMCRTDVKQISWTDEEVITTQPSQTSELQSS